MTKSEEMDELKTRIRARASDRARLAQSIIERILVAPTTARRMKVFKRSHLFEEMQSSGQKSKVVAMQALNMQGANQN